MELRSCKKYLILQKYFKRGMYRSIQAHLLAFIVESSVRSTYWLLLEINLKSSH